MEKKTLTAIIAIVILIAVFTAVFVYYSKELEKSQHFIFKGVNSDYTFDIVRLEGVKGLFYKTFIYVTYDNNEKYKIYITFKNDPRELDDISFEDSNSILYNEANKKDKIYITQDLDLPNLSQKTSTVAAMDITKVTYGLANVFIYNIPTESAYTNLTQDLIDRGINQITCKNADKTAGVILIKIGSENRIYKENDNCVVLEAKTYDDITRVTDRFIMNIIGIF